MTYEPMLYVLFFYHVFHNLLLLGIATIYPMPQIYAIA